MWGLRRWPPTRALSPETNPDSTLISDLQPPELWTEIFRQDGGVGGPWAHPPLMGTPKSQLTAEKPSVKKTRISPEPTPKFYIQRKTDIRNYETVGGVHSQYNQIPYHPGGQPTNWRIIISQNFSCRSESSEPHARLPSLGVSHWEEAPLEHLPLKACGAWLQELHRTGGNRHSTLRGCIQGPTLTRSQGKSRESIGTWARPTC